MTAAPVLPPPTLTGQISLRAERRGDRTVVTGQRHDGSLRVLRPLYLEPEGQVTAVVVNPGGGYLGGDAYEQRFEVGAGASALVTTQSATRIYRTPHVGATQHTEVVLDAGARLELVPDQVIAYADARYDQSCRVEMTADATFVATEVVTPGWSPDGRPFRYEHVRSRTEVVVAGRLTALDNLVLAPHDGVIGALEGFSHVGTLLAVAPSLDQARVDAVAALLADADGVRWGVSRLGCPGLSVRLLGRDTDTVTRWLTAVLTLLRGTPPTLRKY
ncbi:urease accessory protein UreD [Propioniciclava soli]|uniref:Urease accessory protein UreD n=1 Tax=Propioniciclava soli TaxID=2775081 RepID=A0ABZ3C7G2_9ACTN